MSGVHAIELRELPDAIDVRLPDERGREVHSARAWRYVPESDNAKLRELVQSFLYGHADYIAEGNYFIGDLDLEHAMHHNQAYFRREAKRLGIEVDD